MGKSKLTKRSSLPQWLNTLLDHQFYEPCLSHTDNIKPLKNIFCFDCCASLCHKCMFRHRRHILLQVRRYVYNDVLRLVDAEKLTDCSGVQAYISNKEKVVFIRERPYTGRYYKCPRPDRSCLTCNRNIRQSFHFCSLACKVKHVISTQGSLKINLANQEMLTFCDVDDDDDDDDEEEEEEYYVTKMTPDSVLDSTGSFPSSTSSASTTLANLRAALLCTATTEVVRKKRSKRNANRGSNQPVECPQPEPEPEPEPEPQLQPEPEPEPQLQPEPEPEPEPQLQLQATKPSVNRRKTVPNRSPMC